jgi:hypothetical protein
MRPASLPLAVALAGALSGCFPTLHNARVEPGLRLDAGFTYLADQPRGGEPQRHDGLATVTPAYGFGDRVEIGLPLGVYWEDGIGRSSYATGTQSAQVVLLPYAKVALLPRRSRDHLAAVVQAAGIFPGSVGLRYGRAQGGWEPHVGLTYIFSAGPAGDSPVVTRYQEPDQFLMAGSVGATVFGRVNAAVEAGVLLNSYRSNRGFDMPPERVTHYDLFVGMRLGP